MAILTRAFSLASTLNLAFSFIFPVFKFHCIEGRSMEVNSDGFVCEIESIFVQNLGGMGWQILIARDSLEKSKYFNFFSL